MLSVVPLVLHTLGAPLGVPVADDIGQIHHEPFSGRHSWLDNGGSNSYWRPLAYQGYYSLLTNLILTRPGMIAALHAALLSLASLLPYRVAGGSCRAPAAPLRGDFPILAESTRALIRCDPLRRRGLLLFPAGAHEAAAGRLWTSLLGQLAALLCKESAVATALLVPWLVPPTGGRIGGRLRWIAGVAGVVAAWALVYVAVQSRTGLLLPRAMAANLGAAGTNWPQRYAWAATGSARAIFSLPATRTPWDGIFVTAVVVIAIAAVVCFARDPAARGRFASIAPLAGLGSLWTAIATAPLATVFPVWSPQRVAFNSLGLGTALSATLGAAHTALLGSLVALRLGLFAMSPGPPARVSMAPPETGAFVDFAQLVRLQRLLAETRGRLEARFPHLTRGAGVVQHNLPRVTYYAFGGDQALQVWYRDSTLRWVPFDTFRREPALPVVTVVEWQPVGPSQVALVAPDAMRALIRASDRIAGGEWAASLVELDRADSLQDDPDARVFIGTVASKRALGLVAVGRPAEAERAALAGLAAWPANPDSRYALAQLRMAGGRLGEAESELDSLLALYPDDGGAVALRQQVRAQRARTGR